MPCGGRVVAEPNPIIRSESSERSSEDEVYYPAFEIPSVGGGTLIAVVAIVHVFIAQSAVGAGLFMAVSETLARRRGDELVLRFLRDASKYLVYLAFVAGAISGVAIWFSISLVSPRATSLLIHNFVWAWVTEWVFFAVEIAAGYAYYYGWDRLSPRRHIAAGWVYAGASWMSLFVINGIITFMLTPGRWQALRAEEAWSAAYWAGLFNPTFWPSLILRTLSSMALAGIFACVFVNLLGGYGREERIRIVRIAAGFMSPLVLMTPVAVWYFVRVPSYPRGLALGGSAAMTLFFVFGLVCSVLIALYALALIRRRGYVSLETSLLLASMAFVATGAMEYVREGIRKPYVVRGYLWSNGIANQPAEFARLRHDGILAHSPWIAPPDRLAQADARTRGRWVFQAQCSQCHTVAGVNGIKPLVIGWDRALTRKAIDHLDQLKGFMPPFIGTDAEKDALTEYLYSLNPVTHDEPPIPLVRAAVLAEAAP